MQVVWTRSWQSHGALGISSGLKIMKAQVNQLHLGSVLHTCKNRGSLSVQHLIVNHSAVIRLFS